MREPLLPTGRGIRAPALLRHAVELLLLKRAPQTALVTMALKRYLPMARVSSLMRRDADESSRAGEFLYNLKLFLQSSCTALQEPGNSWVHATD